MYSFYVCEDITIKDQKGLKEYLKRCIKDKYFIGYRELIEKMLKKVGKDEMFSDWNDIKLISYWYDEEVKFLDGLSKYIEGLVSWDYETNEYSGEVLFEKGKTIYKLGEMKYDRFKGSELKWE